MTEAEYLQAKRNLENPEVVREMLRIINIQLAPMWGYSAFKHEPHAAVQVVTEMKFVLGDFMREFVEMDEFEENREEQSDE